MMQINCRRDVGNEKNNQRNEIAASQTTGGGITYRNYQRKLTKNFQTYSQLIPSKIITIIGRSLQNVS